MHSLPIKEEANHDKQKPRKIHPLKALLVKKEIEKYLNFGFIRPIDYSEWMGDIVLITKPNGEIITYINFRDIKMLVQKMIFHCQILI